MADRIYTWQQSAFYGGFSDDRFIGIENSFRYGKAVEIRKNPNSLTLAYKVEKDFAPDARVLAMVTIQSTGDLIAFGTNGKIWRKAGGTWAHVYTDTGGASIINAIEYNDYLYWATSGNIHRIAISNIDDDWTGDVTEDYKAFSNGNSNAHPAIEVSNKLYWGDGYYLAELDSLGTWTADKLEIFHDEEIRTLTYGGQMMRLFARKTAKIDQGAKYYWDAATAAYKQRVNMNLLVHTAIASDGQIDYVLAGKRPFLLKTQGYQSQKMKRLPLVYDNQTCYIAPNAIDYYDGLLVFGLADDGSDISMGRGVLTWGGEDDKYPDVLNFDYPTSNDNITDNVYCVHNSAGELYFSWYDGTNYGIDKVNTSKYASYGSLHSLVMTGERSSREKTARAIEVSCDDLASGEEIKVYARKNLATSWETDPEIDFNYTDDAGTYFKRLDDGWDIGDFNFLETKIYLSSGDSDLTTPEVVSVITEFEEIEKGN